MNGSAIFWRCLTSQVSIFELIVDKRGKGLSLLKDKVEFRKQRSPVKKIKHVELQEFEKQIVSFPPSVSKYRPDYDDAHNHALVSPEK